RSRARCSINWPCCSADLIRTKRMVGRRTASQIASASAASFLLRLTQPFTSFAGIRRTSWPSFVNSRAQWCDVAQASMPTKARRQSFEERYNLAAAKLLSDDDLLGRVNAVNLELLGDIQTNRGNLHVNGSPDVIR